jgi:hypothetical protein
MMKGGIDEQIYDSLGEKTRVIKKVVESSIANIEEEVEMAKHSLEDNIERIADALERLSNVAEGVRASAPAPADEGPVAPPAAPKAAKKAAKPTAAAPEMDAQGLLAYSNKKVLAITDPEVRKSTVQAIVARLKAECGVSNIKTLPPEQISIAKTIVDEVFNEMDAGL